LTKGAENNILSDLIDKYGKYILNRSISVFNKASLHHRKWILNEKKKQLIYWEIGEKIEENNIDEIDRKILFSLNKNARISIIEISDKLNISSSLIIQRIKKLLKKGIIQAFRAGLNREKLNIDYCKSLIYYQNKTTEKEKELLNYCKNLLGIIGISQSIGSWDLELEFELKNYKEFHKVMKEIKNKFELVRNFDTLYIEKEYGESFIPKKL